jgi:hypothetical protein
MMLSMTVHKKVFEEENAFASLRRLTTPNAGNFLHVGRNKHVRFTPESFRDTGPPA